MKPQDLFVGIREFLALIVPGSLLLIFWPYMAIPWIAEHARIDLKVESSLIIFMFFVCSLGIGGVLNGVGSLIDDKVDDYIEDVSDGKRTLPGRLANLQYRILGLRKLEVAATEARQQLPKGRYDVPAISTRSFWWSYLRLTCPVAIAELDRVEALQKQFRSFVPTAFLLAFANIVHAIFTDCEVTMRLTCAQTLSFIDVAERIFIPIVWLTVGLAFFIKYVGYRVQFKRRLFEFALLCNKGTDG